MWYSKVRITDLNGVAHDLDPEVLNTGEALQLNMDHLKADDFFLRFEDYDGDKRDWLVRGCIVEIYVDTFKPPTTRRFYGMVEEVKEDWILPTTIMVKVTGRDKFSIYLDRKVTETYLDEKASAIVRDLMARYMSWGDHIIRAINFHEGSGTNAEDASKYTQDATLSEDTWRDGKYGKAPDLDGVDAWVSVPDVSSLLDETKGAIILFAYQDQTQSGGRGLVHIPGSRPLVVLDGSSGLRCGWVGATGFPVANEWTNAYTFSLTTPHCVIFSWEGSNYWLFMDGELKESGDSVTLPAPSTGAVEVGRYSTNYLDGYVDELIIQNEPIKTVWEAKSLYLYPYLHDIDATTDDLDDVRFPYRTLKECLDWLAGIEGFIYRDNPNRALIFREAASEDTGITYDSNDVSPGSKKLSSLYAIKNRVFVLGGNYMEVDQEQTTIAGAPKNTKDKWYAQSFTPEKSGLDQITLRLSRTGSPANLEGEIRTDNGGSGPDETVASFTIDKDFVETTEKWRPVAVSATLLIDVKYWIVLQKTGDATNYYEWAHDNDTAGENANSDDGATWVVNASSYQMAFKTHFKVPILAVKQDYASRDSYMWRETVHTDKAIMSRDVARQTAQALLDELKDETPNIRSLNTINQTAIPDRGKLVTIDLSPLKISSVQYEVKKVSFSFSGGEDGTNYMDVHLGRSAEELDEWLNRLRLDIDRAAIGSFGVDVGLVNLVEAIGPDAVTAGDSLAGSQKGTGTFQIGTAKIGFSDVG